MKTALARLIAATLTTWIVLVWPACLLWGAEVAVPSLSACLLCLFPSMLTLAWAVSCVGGKAEQQVAAVLGGMLVRMVVVLAGALILFFNVPILHAVNFWIWVLVFYLLSLALEMALVLASLSRTTAEMDQPAGPGERAAPSQATADTFSQ